MPNADTIRTLITSRYPRSMDAWFERLDRALADGGHKQPVVVRILPTGSHPERSTADNWITPGQGLDIAARSLKVRVLRHLGNDEYVVDLQEAADEDQLALRGHLDITRGPYRMIAI